MAAVRSTPASGEPIGAVRMTLANSATGDDAPRRWGVSPVTPEDLIAAGEQARSPSVLIVEDHELLTQLLVGAFGDEGIDDVTVVAPGELHVEAVMDLARRTRPDVVLLDLHLGGPDTAMGYVDQLVAAGSAVLVMTASDDPVLLGKALEAGAAGIFSKVEPFEILVDQVRDAARGDAAISAAARDRLLGDLRQSRRAERNAHEPFTDLTGRERVVLASLVRGATADQIAVDEHVTLATVRSQIQGVLRKLGVNSQLLAVAMARAADWAGSDDGPS